MSAAAGAGRIVSGRPASEFVSGSEAVGDSGGGDGDGEGEDVRIDIGAGEGVDARRCLLVWLSID